MTRFCEMNYKWCHRLQITSCIQGASAILHPALNMLRNLFHPDWFWTFVDLLHPLQLLCFDWTQGFVVGFSTTGQGTAASRVGCLYLSCNAVPFWAAFSMQAAVSMAAAAVIVSGASMAVQPPTVLAAETVAVENPASAYEKVNKVQCALLNLGLLKVLTYLLFGIACFACLSHREFPVIAVMEMENHVNVVDGCHDDSASCFVRILGNVWQRHTVLAVQASVTSSPRWCIWLDAFYWLWVLLGFTVWPDSHAHSIAQTFASTTAASHIHMLKSNCPPEWCHVC